MRGGGSSGGWTSSSPTGELGQRQAGEGDGESCQDAAQAVSAEVAALRVGAGVATEDGAHISTEALQQDLDGESWPETDADVMRVVQYLTDEYISAADQENNQLNSIQ